MSSRFEPEATYQNYKVDMSKHKKVIEYLLRANKYNPLNEPDLSSIKDFTIEYVNLYGTKGTKLRKKEVIFNAKLAAMSLVKACKVPKKDLKCGFVYIISNPAWPGQYKVGISHDPKSRLAQYQTYSPNRDYKLEGYHFFFDKSVAEKLIHSSLGATHEWVSVPSSKLVKLQELLSQSTDLRKLLDS